MKLNRRQLRSMLLNEIKSLNELAKVKASNQQSMVALCTQINKAADSAAILFEGDGDELVQTIEMILRNLIKICDAKRDGKTLSGDPKRALLKHVNAIKQDVD